MISIKLRNWLSSLKGEHRQIAKGMITVALFVLIGKVAGAAKEMAVAWRYGISETVDAYLFVFNLVQWPSTIVGGVLGAVLVPLAAKLKHKEPRALPPFRAELWGSALWLSIVLVGVAWFLLPWLVGQSWVGLSSAQLAAAQEMAPMLVWVIPMAIISHLLAAWTMASNRHLNTLLEGIPALSILIAVMLMGGISPLVWGTLLGFLVQVVLLYTALARRGEVEVPKFTFESPHWRFFFAGFGLMLIGQALMSVVNLLDQFFAARLGVGALSTLGYSSRVLSLILGLGALAISRAILPVLSQSSAEGKEDTFPIVIRWAVFLFAVGILVLIVAYWAAPFVVELLFQRGQFMEEDTLRVMELLRYALIQIPFYFSSMVLVYALLSRSLYKSTVVISAFNLLIKLVLAYILVPLMGLNGLMLSTAGVYLGSSLFAAWMLRKTFIKH